METTIMRQLAEAFSEKFPGKPLMFRSPGRVNLIGEHTDYNNGFVLPAAIDRELHFAIAPNNSGTCRFYALNMQEGRQFNLQDNATAEGSWLDYLLGVTRLVHQNIAPVGGFDCVFGGDIPAGAGLSSSAALEGGLAFALNHIFNLKLTREKMALLAQQAEHEYAGVKCGIMDQFASLRGKAGHAIKLDCRSLETEYIPANFEGYKILLCDTGVSHSLASSEYNTRRSECEAGVAALQQAFPQVKSLRDASQDMLSRVTGQVTEVIFKRCSYVIAENQRVEKACEHLRAGELQKFGELMYHSHDGLSQEYEVSCPELDFLVDFTRDRANVAGARMMGGGFGGCTINLVKTEGVQAFVEEIGAAYQQKTGRALKSYITKIVDGTSLLPS